MPMPALDPPQAAIPKAMAVPRAIHARLRLVSDAFIDFSPVVGSARTDHSLMTVRRKLQDVVPIFQLVGASCFGDMHYVLALRDARLAVPRRVPGFLPPRG